MMVKGEGGAVSVLWIVKLFHLLRLSSGRDV